MRTRSQVVDLIVRRGALRRFHKLTERAADLPVAVVWDRRLHDRRSSPDAATGDQRSTDRRNTDRRRTPPFTWELGDFVVVGRGRATTRRPRA